MRSRASLTLDVCLGLLLHGRGLGWSGLLFPPLLGLDSLGRLGLAATGLGRASSSLALGGSALAALGRCCGRCSGGDCRDLFGARLVSGGLSLGDGGGVGSLLALGGSLLGGGGGSKLGVFVASSEVLQEGLAPSLAVVASNGK